MNEIPCNHKEQNLKNAQEQLTLAVQKGKPAQIEYWTGSIVYWSLALMDDRLPDSNFRLKVAACTVLDWWAETDPGRHAEAMKEVTA